MENKVLEEAEFSDKVKLYFMLYVAFILFISVIGIPLLIVWFCGVGQMMGKRYYENLDCKLTTKHLDFKKGVFFKVEKTIPLENIQDLTFLTNPILNWLDLRILKVETAGNSNPQGSDMKLVGIIESQEFKKKVMDQRDRLVNESRSGASNDGSENEVTEVLKEIREVLKEIRDK